MNERYTIVEAAWSESEKERRWKDKRVDVCVFVCVRQNRQYHHFEISFKLTIVCAIIRGNGRTQICISTVPLGHFARSLTASLIGPSESSSTKPPCAFLHVRV